MQRSQNQRISASIANKMSMFENAGICLPLAAANIEGRVSDSPLHHHQSPSKLCQQNLTDSLEFSTQYGRTTPPIEGNTTTTTTTNMMSMSSSPPPGVQTDSDGLILPKKLKNPCLESTDRKELHRELKFNTKIGKSVLNQKTELQRAYEKQQEKQKLHQQQQQQIQDKSPIGGLKSELNRVIMERAQKHEQTRQQDSETDEDKQYVNPEYLNVRAKLRPGQHSELK